MTTISGNGAATLGPLAMMFNVSSLVKTDEYCTLEDGPIVQLTYSNMVV